MNRARMTAQIKTDEGFRSAMYKDSVGVPTIGYGRNLLEGISEEEAAFLLANDIEEAIEDARVVFPQFESMGDIRQEVLVNMVFNLGATRLLRFKRMRAAIAELDFGKAADEMIDSLWARQVKSRAVRLAGQMRTGEA